MRLSIVSTLYCSAPYLDEFCRRAVAAARQLTDSFEIVLVNDGSPDDSLARALALQREQPALRIVDLSRNFGHHKAIMTGLAHARGELVFVIDCDLEEEPELLGALHAELQRAQADVAFGLLPTRRGGWFERVSGWLFYRMFNLLSTDPIEPGATMARLMTRRYVDALLQHREQELFLMGVWQITGFRQVPVPATKSHKGRSTYGLRRKLALMVNAITSFSNRPLVFIFYLGCLIVTLATVAAGALIIRRLFFGHTLIGWSSLIVSIWMLGGLTIFCLGIVGIYLSKVFVETKQRPYTIVRAVHEAPELPPPSGS